MVLNIIYTLLWGAFFVLVAPILIIVAALILLVTLPLDHQRRSQCHYSRFIHKFYVGASPWMRVVVKGLENIDKRQTYLIISNHQSMLDILFMYKVPLCFKWVSKREVYRIPLVGQLLWLHGDVPVKRGDAASVKKMLADCSYWLQRGMNIVIFPEGTRSKTGQIGDFKEGAFILAKKNKVPILPIVIDGTRSFSNGNKWNLLNARQIIQISILPTISNEEVETTSIRTLKDSCRTLMEEEHKQLTRALF